MKRTWPALLAALPGLVLVVLAASCSLAPTHSDLPGYFVPLRDRTAAVLAGERGPFWNPDVGCGEPYFANPQTGLLYPPVWLGGWLGSHRGLGVEAGLHLALLGLGCAALARRLGATATAACAAGIGAVLAGPTADAVGVLNNLATLAWAPWVWWAVLAGRPGIAASALAGAWLGAEPQLTVLVALIALLLAPTRRSVAALAVGGLLVAVQAVPFVAWVLAGNRGSHDVAGTPSGGLLVSDLTALVVPSRELASRPDVFLAHPYLPVWILLFAVVAVTIGPRLPRRLAWVGLALLVVPLVAVVPGGDQLWAALTRGMVRFPARLVMLAVVALAPAAASVVAGWPRQRRLVLAAAVAAAGPVALVSGNGPIAAAGILATGLAAAGTLPGVAVVVGSAVLVAPFTAVLSLSPPTSAPGPVLCAAAQSGFRVYTVAPSWDQFAWVVVDPEPRGRALGFGYTGLGGDRRFVRSFAPVASRALAAHLAEADRGPVGRWWLDALATPRVVSHHPVPSLPELCAEGGVHVAANPTAFPEVQVLAALPAPGERPSPAGEVRSERVGDDAAEWRVTVAEGGGVLVRAATPDPGWRFLVDGREAPTLAGVGILHGVAVDVGEHVVTARYRPPGMVLGAAASVLGLVALGAGWLRRGVGRREEAPGQ